MVCGGCDDVDGGERRYTEAKTRCTRRNEIRWKTRYTENNNRDMREDGCDPVEGMWGVH